MTVEIFPSIDLRDGKCVRLLQGDYARQIDYADDPVAQAKLFEQQGATWLHIVDLEGALHGRRNNAAVVEKIVNATSLKVELGGGIRVTGMLTQVSDTHFTVRTGTGERTLPLSTISTEEVVRLASHKLPPEVPINAISFALFYAADGEFGAAYEQLRAAALGGHDITVARSQIDAGHLWSAALRREAALAQAATGPAQPGQSITEGPAVHVLVDLRRGRKLPDQLTGELERRNFTVTEVQGALREQHLEKPALLVIWDPGSGRGVPAYDAQQIQRTINFVRAGGALVFFGAPRPRDPAKPDDTVAGPPGPFEPLLRWCGITPRSDALSLADDAPEGYPAGYALAAPVARHAVTQGVQRVAFPIASPSLALQRKGWVLVRASKYVTSKVAGETAPAMVAGRPLGAGRVLVFVNMPEMRTSPWGAAGSEAKQAQMLVLNGLIWASGPARNAAREED